jgi:excisionase family DNA binding protein
MSGFLQYAEYTMNSNNDPRRGGCSEESEGTPRPVHRKRDLSVLQEAGHEQSRPRTPEAVGRRLLTPKQAANYLGISTRQLRRLFLRGHFGAIASRHFVRYDVRDLDQWIEDQKEVHMKASLYLRGETWWMRYTHNGRDVRRSCETSSREQAQARLDRELAQIHVFGISDSDSVRLVDLVNEQLSSYRAQDRNDYAKAAQARWDNHMAKFFGNVKVKALTPADFDKYREHRRNEKAEQGTINLELALVRKAMRSAARAMRIVRVPHVAMAKVNNARKRFISEAERDRLFAAASRYGLWARVYCEMAFLFGWRRKELCAITVDHINLVDRTVRIDTSKNGDAREIPMPSRLALLVQQLASGKAPRETLFPGYFKVGDVWEKIRKDAGLEDVVIHDWRRTSAKTKVDAGIPQHRIMQMHGWRTSEMFRRYALIDQSDIRRDLDLMDRTLSAQTPPNAQN